MCRHFTPGHEPICKVYSYPTDPAQLDQSASQSRQEADDEGLPVEALEMLFMQGMPAWKRALDLAGATVGLVMLAPVFLLIAVRDETDFAGTQSSSAMASWARRSTICDVQVPLDDRRGGIAQAGFIGPERTGRARRSN